MLWWAQCSFYKKRVGTRYAKIVFLHLVGSAGHIVHSGARGAPNVGALFSCWGGPGTVSIKIAPGDVTPTLCFLHLVGSTGHRSRSASWYIWGTKRQCVIIPARMGLVLFP
jgi:hypothetical protein